MERKHKIIIAIVAVLIVGAGAFFFYRSRSGRSGRQQIDLESKKAVNIITNAGPVSPISGLSCDDWNRRPFAIMEPSDTSARPISGISEADMVIEMPAIYGGITRLMGVYVCGNPERVGSMRSSRHDYIPLAAGLDAIYVHWGGSHFALDKLKEGVIDDLNCNNDGGQSAAKYCYRESMDYLDQGKAFPNVPTKSDDTGYAKFADLVQGANDFGYDMTDKFAGYSHQEEAAEDQRPAGGKLRVGYPKPFTEEFDYDKASNSYVRTWGGVLDTDRNNGDNIKPKNVVVMIADGAQMESQYANFQVGDPWYDDSDSGTAYFYMNGQEVQGTWKKDKSKIDSKLTFYNPDGSELAFVPGQIWVNIIDPGIGFKWTAAQ